MGKSGQAPRGALVQAEKILARPDRSNPAELRKALALLNGTSVYTPAQIAERYGDSDHFTVQENGSVALAQQAAKPSAEDWVVRTQALQSRREQPVVFNPKMQAWRMQDTPVRSRNGIAAELRNAQGSPTGRLALAIGETTVRYAMLSTADHLRRGEPYAQLANATESLGVVAVRRRLDCKEKGMFEATLDPDDTPLYEASSYEEARLVRVSQALGSFTRQTVLTHHETPAKLHVAQNVDVIQHTIFAVDPAWQDLLFEAEPSTEASNFAEVHHETASTIEAFVSDQDMALVPMGSTMYMTQQFQVLNGRMC